MVSAPRRYPQHPPPFGSSSKAGSCTSAAQDRNLAAIRAAGLPDPEGDADIGGGFTADFLWRDARVAAEYDSRQWQRTNWARARDRRKDVHCEREGITLVRVEAIDLRGDLLLGLIARLAALIAGGEARAA
jgi:hypothetical protein